MPQPFCFVRAFDNQTSQSSRRPLTMMLPTTDHSQVFEVLIVGAGPVGLFLAIRLKKQGIHVAIVERQKSIYPLPRAVVFDHESRRLLSSALQPERLDAILENVIGAGGQDGVNFVWRDKDLKLIADLHWEKPTRSGTPFAMGFSQPELEALLVEQATELGVNIFRGLEVLRVKEDAKGTSITCLPFDRFAPPRDILYEGLLDDALASGDKVTTFKGQYLVACDGANSSIRRLVGIENFNLPFQNDWLIIDLLLKDGAPIPEKVKKIGCSQICDPERPTTVVFAGHGRKRFEFMRLPHETHDSLLQDVSIWSMIAPWGFHPDNCAIERKTIYTFNARWAKRFSKGNVILAGDALHLMPPFIGQGLNSGFRDAGSLAWRLPLMLRGQCSAQALLKTYQSERLSHIKALTEHCILLGKVICETDRELSARIHAELRANPPTDGFDPPLGQPGILTTQSEAGKLSLQRPLQLANSKDIQLFDSIYGTTWHLVTMAHVKLQDCLNPKLAAFFASIGGNFVHINENMDFSGDYKRWFVNDMSLDDAVLIRPDFYVFGHTRCSRIDDLVGTLQLQLEGTRQCNSNSIITD